jgi:hypothetical protein
MKIWGGCRTADIQDSEGLEALPLRLVHEVLEEKVPVNNESGPNELVTHVRATSRSK